MFTLKLAVKVSFESSGFVYLTESINGGKFNIEIIDLGSFKLNIKWGEN